MLPIAFCIMLLIFLLAGCDSIIEYIVCSLFSMFGSWSTEYNIYIPEGSFIQDGYGISLE